MKQPDLESSSCNEGSASHGRLCCLCENIVEARNGYVHMKVLAIPNTSPQLIALRETLTGGLPHLLRRPLTLPQLNGAARYEPVKLRHLVLDEGQERADDERDHVAPDPAIHIRRELVAEGLAAAGGHYREAVLEAEGCFYGGKLGGGERRAD